MGLCLILLQAKTHHPDKVLGDKEEAQKNFHKIAEAYAGLTTADTFSLILGYFQYSLSKLYDVRSFFPLSSFLLEIINWNDILKMKFKITISYNSLYMQC